jgi:AAA15 family ATPase/GTPase
MKESPKATAFVQHLLASTGTGVSKLKVVPGKPDPLSFNRNVPEFEELNAARIQTLHQDASGIEHWLALADESLGTQRLISLAGHIYLALEEGRCLWVDELNHSLHHWLLRALVGLFQNPGANPNGAQLIFTTHDPALMDPTLLRRDQIWITEKDSARSTTLYSLSEFEDKPRKSQPLYKAFLSGRFGGVPMQLDAEKLLHWNRPEGT